MTLSIHADLAPLRAWLEHALDELNPAIDEAVTEALYALIDALVPVTPVRTGAMRASYEVGYDGQWTWYLINLAQSPRGYDYPERVFEDPGWSRQYVPLNDALDAGIAQLETSLDAAIERLVVRRV